MHNHLSFYANSTVKMPKINDNYIFSTGNGLLVLDPTVLTMVGRYRADVFGVPARGTMMLCGIMHTTSLFCGNMASWE